MVIEWERSALPVLQALADCQDKTVRDGYLGLGHGGGARTLGLDVEDGELHDALLALTDVGYIQIDDIQYEGGGSGSVLGARVTGRGMQALGRWPSLQAAMSPVTLVAVPERLRDYAPDETARARLDVAVESARGVGTKAVQEAVASFAAEALKQKLGLR
jgi:hypothetical protein